MGQATKRTRKRTREMTRRAEEGDRTSTYLGCVVGFQPEGVAGESLQNPLFVYGVGDIVWARSPKRNGLAWPAEVIGHTSGSVPRICVLFFGEERDYASVTQGMISPFLDCFQEYQMQTGLEKSDLGDFCLATQEATMAEYGFENQQDYPRNQNSNVTCVKSKHLQYHNTADNKASAYIPDHLIVICNRKEADYLPKLHLIMCECSECGKGTTMSICNWEKHVGCKTKNWKKSVRLKDSTEFLIDWINQKHKAGVCDLGFYSPQGGTPGRFGERELTSFLQKPYTAIKAKWGYGRCAVCRGFAQWEGNELLICNRCPITVHRECYGAREVHNIASWICRACETPDIKRECCLCPVMGGALKPSTTGQLWVHVTCAWFSSTVSFQNDKTMEPADGILRIGPESFQKMCIICNEMHGSCIKCFQCQTFYHAMCASIAGYSMEVNINDDHDKILNISYCASHRTPTPDATLTLTKGDPNKNAALPIKAPHGQYSNSNKAELRVKKYKSDSVLVIVDDTKCKEPPASRCRVYNRVQDKEKSAIRATVHRAVGYCSHRAEVIEALNALNQEADPVQEFSSSKERLFYMQKTEKKRVCVGKSGIHGWGLFARRYIQEGEMVMEFRGEIVRASVANIREIRADLQRKRSYQFKFSDEIVVDASEKGSMARFINHSCAPNCFARKMGESKLVVVAKKDIAASHEITMDYMYPPGEPKIPCFCGVASCRRFMN